MDLGAEYISPFDDLGVQHELQYDPPVDSECVVRGRRCSPTWIVA
jgi:hypothetical protein